MATGRKFKCGCPEAAAVGILVWVVPTREPLPAGGGATACATHAVLATDCWDALGLWHLGLAGRVA